MTDTTTIHARIGLEHVEALGRVDEALGDYYATAIASAAARTGVPEREIRSWVERTLVNDQGFRTQALVGPGAAGDDVLRALEDAHILRTDSRRGAKWYELSHDRLVGPVNQNNSEWRAANLTTVQTAATVWAHEGRPDHLLLTDEELAHAEQWAAEHPEQTSPTDDSFIAASRERQSVLEARTRARRRNRILLVVALTLALVTALVAWIAYREQQDANRADEGRASAEAQALTAEEARAEAVRQAQIAREALEEADRERGTAAEAREEAARQLRIAEQAQADALAALDAAEEARADAAAAQADAEQAAANAADATAEAARQRRIADEARDDAEQQLLAAQAAQADAAAAREDAAEAEQEAELFQLQAEAESAAAEDARVQAELTIADAEAAAAEARDAAEDAEQARAACRESLDALPGQLGSALPDTATRAEVISTAEQLVAAGC